MGKPSGFYNEGCNRVNVGNTRQHWMLWHSQRTKLQM